MAEAAGPLRTRCPCLATARAVVAAFVSALTITMLVTVTILAFRPVTLRLSIIHGDMWSDTPWPSSTKRTDDYDDHRRSGGAAATLLRPDNKQQVKLWFTLRADNPSGRGNIHCANLTIRVSDMPSSPDSFDGLKEIMGEFHLPEPFFVKRQSSHTLTRSVTVTDGVALSYIQRTYGRAGTFDAMVQVDAFVSTSWMTPRSHEHDFIPTRCYCWPIRVGWGAHTDSADDVTCKNKDEMGIIPVISQPLAPAPAAGPTSGRAASPSSFL